MAKEYFFRTENFTVWNMDSKKGKDLIGFKRVEFSKLVKIVVKDWSKSDVQKLEYGLTINLIFNRNKEKEYLNLEKKLHNELLKNFKSDAFRKENEHLMPTYKFEDEDARDYLIDYLQVYGNNYKTIDYKINDVIGVGGKIITIELYKEQSFSNKITGNLGGKVKEISFPLNMIKTLEGNTLQFELTFSANEDVSLLKTLIFDNSWS